MQFSAGALNLLVAFRSFAGTRARARPDSNNGVAVS